jgi:ribosomal-protein-alanine N-acetyltransferase
MYTLKYRPMNLEDISRVHEIDVLSFSLPWPEKSFQFELTQNPSTIAIVNELIPPGAMPIIIGMVVVWIMIDEAHIATIAIDPQFRGHGIGKKLLAETLRQSIQRGAVLATLEVREHNHITQQMYQKFGFEIVGRRPKYYQDTNEDAVLMTLNNLGEGYLTWMDNLGI